jgi:hypothetical protein
MSNLIAFPRIWNLIKEEGEENKKDLKPLSKDTPEKAGPEKVWILNKSGALVKVPPFSPAAKTFYAKPENKELIASLLKQKEKPPVAKFTPQKQEEPEEDEKQLSTVSGAKKSPKPSKASALPKKKQSIELPKMDKEEPTKSASSIDDLDIKPSDKPETPPAIKRGRGRPKKNPTAPSAVPTSIASPDTKSATSDIPDMPKSEPTVSAPLPKAEPVKSKPTTPSQPAKDFDIDIDYPDDYKKTEPKKKKEPFIDFDWEKIKKDDVDTDVEKSFSKMTAQPGKQTKTKTSPSAPKFGSMPSLKSLAKQEKPTSSTDKPGQPGKDSVKTASNIATKATAAAKAASDLAKSSPDPKFNKTFTQIKKKVSDIFRQDPKNYKDFINLSLSGLTSKMPYNTKNKVDSDSLNIAALAGASGIAADDAVDYLQDLFQDAILGVSAVSDAKDPSFRKNIRKK